MTVLKLRHDTLWRDRGCGQLVAQQLDDVRSAQQRMGLRMQHAFAQLKLHGQHHQGHVVMPRQPAAGLIVGQAQLKGDLKCIHNGATEMAQSRKWPGRNRWKIEIAELSF